MKSRPHKAQEAQNGFIRPKHLLCVVVFFVAMLSVFAATYPQWWAGRGVLNTNANIVTNDFAPATLGQLKWMATKAREEFTNNFPSVVWTNLPGATGPFSTSSNFAPATIGQLKAVVLPFYNALMKLGLADDYPWHGTNINDYAPLLIGQMKNVFSMGLSNPTNRLMPAAFGITSDCGLLYFVHDDQGGDTGYGQLMTSHLTALSAGEAGQGSWQGASCDGTNIDDEGTSPCMIESTALWRAADGVHIRISRNEASPQVAIKSYAGSLDLHRAYFTGGSVLSVTGTNSVAHLTEQSPCKVSWTADLANFCHAEFLLPWSTPTNVMSPHFSLTLGAGGGPTNLSTFMAPGDSQTFAAKFSAAVNGTYTWIVTSNLVLNGSNSASVSVTAGPGASPTVGADRVTCTFCVDGLDDSCCVTSFPVTVVAAHISATDGTFCVSCSNCTPPDIAIDLLPSDAPVGTLHLDVRTKGGTTVRTLFNASHGGGTFTTNWNGLQNSGTMAVLTQYVIHAEWIVAGVTCTNESAFKLEGVWFTTNEVVIVWTNGSFDASALVASNSLAYDGFSWEISPPFAVAGDAEIDSTTGKLTFGTHGGAYVVTAHALDASSSNSYFESCCAVATVTVAKIDLLVDTDRNGALEAGDESGKSDATTCSIGALMPPRDISNAVGNSLEGLAKVIIRAPTYPQPANASLQLIKPASGSGPYVNLLDANSNIVAVNNGSFAIPAWPSNDTTYYAYSYYAAAPGSSGTRKIIADNPTNSLLTLQLVIGGTVACRDSVRLAVAPLILPPEYSPPQKIYSTCTITGIPQLITPTGLSGGYEQWTQDMVKFVKCQINSGGSDDVFIDLTHDGRGNFPDILSNSQNWNHVTWSLVGNPGNGGNMMATPPLPDAPFGKLLIGDKHDNAESYWSGQHVQKVEPISTTWLYVGHVDEIFMWVAPNKVLYASPQRAADLLHQEIVAGHEGNTLWFGRDPINGKSTNIEQVVIADDGNGGFKLTTLPQSGMPDSTNQTTIVFSSAIFAAGDVLRVENEILTVTSTSGPTVTVSRASNHAAHAGNAKIYAYSNLMKKNLPLDSTTVSVSEEIAFATNQLITALGSYASSVNFVEVPVLFGSESSLGTTDYAAYSANMVNCLVGFNGVVYYPDPGCDVFRSDFTSKVPGAQAIDDWALYHCNYGEIHCGTAAQRSLDLSTPWWLQVQTWD